MPDVQNADSGARRRTLVLMVVGVAVGASTILIARRLLPAVEAWVAEDAAGRLPTVAVVAALIPTAPLAAFGAYLWHLGSRVVGARRFPPPGLRVARDVPVVEGATAVRRGRTLRTMGVVIVVAAAAAAALIWRLLTSLAERG